MKIKPVTVETYYIEQEDIEAVDKVTNIVEKFCRSDCDTCPFKDLCELHLDYHTSLLEFMHYLGDTFENTGPFTQEL